MTIEFTREELEIIANSLYDNNIWKEGIKIHKDIIKLRIKIVDLINLK